MKISEALEQLSRDIGGDTLSGGGYQYIEADPEALRAVVAHLTMPPADDVREALARTMRPDLDWDRVCDSEDRDVQIAHSIPRDTARKAAERVLAAFEVRPHGPVTEAERQAVADAIDNAAVITPRNEFLGGSTIANILEVADAALKAAREVHS